MSEIRADSVGARTSEGDTVGADGWNKAFVLWGKVYQKIERFHKDFYMNPNVEWARRKTFIFLWRLRGEGVAIGVAASLLAAFIWHMFSK